jgi:hypothetical protein
MYNDGSFGKLERLILGSRERPVALMCLHVGSVRPLSPRCRMGLLRRLINAALLKIAARGRSLPITLVGVQSGESYNAFRYAHELRTRYVSSTHYLTSPNTNAAPPEHACAKESAHLARH